MIEMVSRAEEFIARRRKATAAPARRGTAEVAQVAPILAAPAAKKTRQRGRMAPPRARIPRHRCGAQFHQCPKDLARAEPGRRGDAGPHHPYQLAAGAAAARPDKTCRLRPRRTRYGGPIRRALSGYFEQHNARVGHIKHELDPMPRVVLVPGLGLFGLGRTKRDAESQPTSPKPGSRASATPKPSAASIDLRSRHVRLRILAA